jgi:hypothetical protein
VRVTGRLGAVALLLLVVAAGCAGTTSLEHGDRGVHYRSVEQLVAAANTVVVGRVVGTGRGQVLDQQDVVFTMRNVRVQVEQVWAGRMPTPAFTIEQAGWERTMRRPGWRGLLDPAGEREWRFKDDLRLEQGDRGVFFLAGRRLPTGWEVLGPEGLYLIDGAELVDTGREDPTVRAVEPMTVAQLEAAVRR